MDGSGRNLDERYRVERLLGRGGMGSAFLALDAKVGRRVVVKAPHEELLTDPEFRERFGREIRSLLDLEHPHVVRVIDVGDADGVPYVVLPYLGGGTLRDRMTRSGGTLTVREVVEWLSPVAQALDFLHGRGWLHRDVKPDNVLFDEAGHAFLADFGIVKAAGAVSSSLTRTGPTPGSPKYMAPEAALDRELGPPYDQYALAVVVYECLAGRGPFNAEGRMADALAKASQEPTPLGAVAPQVSSALAAAVMTALARDPARRHTSCAAFAQALQEATVRSVQAGVETRVSRAGEDMTARAEAERIVPPEGHATPSPRPRRRTAFVAGTALVVVAAAVAASLLSNRDATNPPPGAAVVRGEGTEASSPRPPSSALRPEPEATAASAPATAPPPPSDPPPPDRDRTASDAAREAFARADAQVPVDLLAVPRRTVEAARADALGAAADAIAGRYRDASWRWTSAASALAVALGLEGELRPVVTAKASSAGDLKALTPWARAPAWLRARRVAVDAAASAVDRAIALGDVEAARSSVRALSEAIEALRPVVAAAREAEEAGTQWETVEARIPAVPYAKVQDGLEAAKRAAVAARADLDAERFASAASGLRAAADAASPRLAQHEEALRAAQTARAGMPASLSSSATAPAEAEAYAAALGRADAAIASGRFDDVAEQIAVSKAAAARLAAAVSAGRALADPAKQAWDALAAAGFPAPWFDEVAAAAGAAVREAVAAAKDDERGAFADAARGFGGATRALAPLLDRDRRARAAAGAADVAWQQVAERARLAHRLKAERALAAAAAGREAAEGRFVKAEAGWRAVAAQVEADLVARMVPFRMDLSPGPGGVPVGWTADTVVRIGSNGALQGHQERADRPDGIATSGLMDLFGDFRLNLTIYPAGDGTGAISTVLLGADSAPSVRAEFYTGGGSVSLRVTMDSVKTNQRLASQKADFQVSMERRGGDLRLLFNGTYVSSTSVPAEAAFQGVELRFKMKRFHVRSLEIAPL